VTRDPVTAFTHSGMSEAEGQGGARLPDFSPPPDFWPPHYNSPSKIFRPSGIPAMRKRKLSNQDKQVLLLFIIIQKVDVNLHTYLVQ